MPPRKKKTQTKITFEPVGASSSPAASSFSPARIRYSRTPQTSPSQRPGSSAPPSSGRGVPSSSAKSRQSKLNLGPPPASFMPPLYGTVKKNAAIIDSSDESAAEISDAGYDEEDVDALPPTQKARNPRRSATSKKYALADEPEPAVINPRSSQSVSTRLQKTVILDDSDDEVVEAPRSPLKRRRSPSVVSLKDSEEDDSDDIPILHSARKRQPATTFEHQDESDEAPVSPTKRRKLLHRRLSPPSAEANNKPHTPGRLKRPLLASSSPVKSARKGHRSEKQKKMELLRRRRAGERIDRLTSSEESASDDARPKRGIYDSDSQDEFVALKDFDDDDEEEQQTDEVNPISRPHKAKPKREKMVDQEGDDNGEEDEDLENFVTDDDDAPLGAPVDIPLEFTFQAHKPLKEQFPHVVEWLVHNRVNPAFERRDPVYVNAWRKLDDEVLGLARSKFTSSVWRPDFSRALRARPQLDAYETGAGHDLGRASGQGCEACGRVSHPATWRLEFAGSPYHKDTLQEVESSDSDSDSDSGSQNKRGDESDTGTVDVDGNTLPPTTKMWYVGVVCRDNAVTAHSLLHWKYALKQYVEDRLEMDGWMAPAKLREREKMRPKKRRKLANEIVDAWQQRGVISALYADFKRTLEAARNQSTLGRTRHR
ncbi:hypothetical protein F5Y17DRAFT_185772 [Xylariaceae sp. FL0594]|nr:hypothetical protein F5Y17DRAFT_185772 [Xylariaceae sp. FL0594]